MRNDAIEWLALDTLQAENERLHARVSDLTARLRKCADLHRRSIAPTANDAGGGRDATIKRVTNAFREAEAVPFLQRGGKVPIR